MSNEEIIFQPVEHLINGTEPDAVPEVTHKPVAIQKETKDILETIASLRMTCDKIVPTLTPIIKIGESTLSTPGNITVFSGEGKSGKTAALGAVLAGAIAQREYDGFDKVDVQINEKKLAVIHIETEQSESRHQVNHKTIVKRAGLDNTPDYFLSYNIRKIDIAKYKNIVEGACKGGVEKFGGVYLIVIDGIADFVTSVNDEKESNGIIHWLEVLAAKYNAPVIVVVHVNPNSDKERGHIGSQLQRKAESVLFIKRNNDISTIEPKLLRNAGVGETPTVYFNYDKNKGYHVSCDGNSGLIEVTKNLKRIEHVEKVAEKVFGGQKALKYSEAEIAIMKITNGGVTAAKNYFKEMKASELIVQGEDKRWRLSV